MNFSVDLSQKPNPSEIREKTRVLISPSPTAACAALAQHIKQLIQTKAALGQNTILGLATGSTPVPLYRELIRLHREEALSFQTVISFNLDEYSGLSPDHPESYRQFMQDQLFAHVDIPAENIHVPNGLSAPEDILTTCATYEKAIADTGGIDLQILGIGRTGHIGFNEPGSTRDSRTRRITLDRVTREDAASDFMGIENVPRFAITMGVGTILEAKQIFLIAWGENKADIVRRAVEGPATEAISASFLQNHPQGYYLLDERAAQALTRINHPWLVTPVPWTQATMLKAVRWLAGTMKKPVLRLVDEDYNEHGMADLLTLRGSSYNININIFNRIQHTITGWPGGKPGADDTHRPERASPHPKRVLILSPEPQDALTAMGGTTRRLTQQGHEVRFCTMTSASLRVSDSAPERFARGLIELADSEPTGWGHQRTYALRLLDMIDAKGQFGEDTPEIRRLKGKLLRGEVHDATTILGLSRQNLTFLDLPFYEKGRYRRFQASIDDTTRLTALLDEIQPHQIFMTGDAADPSSVSAICYRILTESLRRISASAAPWLRDCQVWLYRSKERDYLPNEINMAVPMSPDEIQEKDKAMRMIQHLTDYERNVTERNKELAKQYDSLGLAEYEALESFQRSGW